eukprot:3283825-Pleurochrysis_carterae.AAC.1
MTESILPTPSDVSISSSFSACGTVRGKPSRMKLRARKRWGEKRERAGQSESVREEDAGMGARREEGRRRLKGGELEGDEQPAE